jgi:hypothetical protein
MSEQRTVNKTMVQVSRAKGETRKFQIYDDKFIDVTVDNIFGQKNYQLNLCMLEPWPVRNRDVSWRWLMSMIYFGIAAVAYGVYLYRSPNVTEFRSRYCGCVLISLLYANPGKEVFDQFVDELKQRILLASQQVRVDKHRMLINEITKLRRLRNDGIISEREYVAASRRIPNMRA